jgi:hypothetical protein
MNQGSGFFKVSDEGRKRCQDPEHDFPTMVYIPPGRGYRHVCPTCERSIVVIGRSEDLKSIAS